MASHTRDLAAMATDKLWAEYQAVEAEEMALHEQRRAIKKELDQRIMAEQASMRVGAMSDAEVEAVAHELERRHVVAQVKPLRVESRAKDTK